MLRQISLLVIAVFALFVLIANAAEELNESYNQSNENGSLDAAISLGQNSANEAYLNDSGSNINLASNTGDNIPINNSIETDFDIANNDENNSQNMPDNTESSNISEEEANSLIDLSNTLINDASTEESAYAKETPANESPNSGSIQMAEPDEDKKESNAVTAGFGVYIQVVG